MLLNAQHFAFSLLSRRDLIIFLFMFTCLPFLLHYRAVCCFHDIHCKCNWAIYGFNVFVAQRFCGRLLFRSSKVKAAICSQSPGTRNPNSSYIELWPNMDQCLSPTSEHIDQEEGFAWVEEFDTGIEHSWRATWHKPVHLKLGEWR